MKSQLSEINIFTIFELNTSYYSSFYCYTFRTINSTAGSKSKQYVEQKVKEPSKY